MPEQFGEKTERATPRRREEVRRRGNVARSVDLSAAAVLLGSTAAVAFLGERLAHTVAELLVRYCRAPAWVVATPADVHGEFVAVMFRLAQGMLPLLLAVAAAALVINLAQVGFLASTTALKPDLARMSPLKGIQRIFSLQGLVRLVVNLLKLAGIAALTYGVLRAELPALAGLAMLEPIEIGRYGVESTLGLAWKICGALFAVALLDYAFQKWKFERDIRMTRQEVRDELKEMEGDPHLRHRRRQIQRQLANQRMARQVPESDVVITNPTELAIAIKYEPHEMAAPVVVAKGAGFVAERIRKIARENDVPLVENKPLAQALYRTVEIGHPVPIELYEAVAEVLAYVYQLKGRTDPFASEN
jgi:flagellar biosynthetic protein FlhB